jgi:hypothetical protein
MSESSDNLNPFHDERNAARLSVHKLLVKTTLNAILDYVWASIVNFLHLQSTQCELGQISVCDWERSGLLYCIK